MRAVKAIVSWTAGDDMDVSFFMVALYKGGSDEPLDFRTVDDTDTDQTHISDAAHAAIENAVADLCAQEKLTAKEMDSLQIEFDV